MALWLESRAHLLVALWLESRAHLLVVALWFVSIENFVATTEGSLPTALEGSLNTITMTVEGINAAIDSKVRRCACLWMAIQYVYVFLVYTCDFYQCT